MNKFSRVIRFILRHLSFWFMFCSGFLLGRYFQNIMRRFQGSAHSKRLAEGASSTVSTSNPSLHQIYQVIPGVLSTQHDTHTFENMQSIQARGVAFYLLWRCRVSQSENFPSPPPDIWQEWEDVGSWCTLHLAWKPVSSRNPEPWLNDTETLQAMTALYNYAEQVAQIVIALRTTSIEPNFPVYSTFHIREIVQRNSLRPRLLPFRLWMRRVSKKEQAIARRRAFMSYILRHLVAFENERGAGWSSANFSHYDHDANERGWIVVHPKQAFVAGVSDNQAQTLINVLQHRDIDLSEQRQGIIVSSYEEVLARIGQWNSTQDIRETVNQLENLVNSGQKSTDGQVLLNLALAAIGVFISLAAAFHIENDQLLWSLTLLCIASLFFWGFARFGKAIWQILGWIACICAILLYTKFL